MRVALISDLHANEVALDAVLADAAREGVDRIICLGDVATLGPEPTTVIDRLRQLGCACILGNHDEFLLDPELIRSYTEIPIVVDAVDWCRSQLGPEDLAFLRTFQRGLDVDLGGGARLALFHGSPRSHMEDLLATTPDDELARALAGCGDAVVMAGGHTHLQLLRRVGSRVLVNSGSVGMPFREHTSGRPPTVLPHAEYAVIGAEQGRIDVDLRRVPLDRTRLRAATRAKQHPLREWLTEQYAD